MSVRTSRASKSDKNILKIDLTGHAPPLHLLKRRTDLNPQPGRHSASDSHDIAAYVNLRGSGSSSSLRLFTRSPGPEAVQGPRERWHHLATEAISFQDFKSFAQDATHAYHVDCMPVVLRLLDEVAEKHEVISAYGSHIRPGTVIRCDGTDSGRDEIPDVSATFISFPFFDVGDGRAPASSDDQSLHMVRDLFQQFYPQEVTTDRDAAQQFRQFRRTKPGQYLRVPQLWVLLLNSATIISCGPRSLQSMGRDFLEIIPQNELLTQTLKMVQVTDFYNRVTCLRADQCNSFLALETISTGRMKMQRYLPLNGPYYSRVLGLLLSTFGSVIEILRHPVHYTRIHITHLTLMCPG
ncbi:hypothetical protein BKA63DRAFT_4739 [Paraphoma chrysanthemicola]|nr:hypothetical protein BKA63DRAFT_4739 [Paraphoma chrysanthemicola]